ncbi:hypothetical protein PVL29_001249 [Vitis rotundifolia]|uniref:Uncharacterized protein n=1 Tax=Vitis rotundifolia TaxID=103349 RepID=A0AA39APX2_VITRO|nr:hypothetical protein PVL29_001249 [Vitis rotundifolia]
MACRRAPQMKGSSLGTKITEEADLGLKIGHSKAFLKSEDFIRKEELIIKAKVNVETVSKQLCGFIYTEVDILSHEQSNLFELNQYFRSSQNNESVRARSEERVSSNQFSIETSVCFLEVWNFWKDEIVNILRYLDGSVKKYLDYKELCLNYLGVLKQFNKQTLYFVLYPEADWVRKTDNRFLHGNGKLVFIDASQFVSAARSY